MNTGSLKHVTETIDSIYPTRDCVPADIKETVRVVLINTFPLVILSTLQRERVVFGQFANSLRL